MHNLDSMDSTINTESVDIQKLETLQSMKS